MIPSPSFLNFSIPVSPLLLYVCYVIFIISWLVYTLILRYHWKKYSVNNVELLQMNLIYFIGSGMIIVLMGASAFLYSLPS